MQETKEIRGLTAVELDEVAGSCIFDDVSHLVRQVRAGVLAGDISPIHGLNMGYFDL